MLRCLLLCLLLALPSCADTLYRLAGSDKDDLYGARLVATELQGDQQCINEGDWRGTFGVSRGFVYQVVGDDLWGGTVKGTKVGNDLTLIDRGGWAHAFTVQNGFLYKVVDDKLSGANLQGKTFDGPWHKVGDSGWQGSFAVATP